MYHKRAVLQFWLFSLLGWPLMVGADTPIADLRPPQLVRISGTVQALHGDDGFYLKDASGQVLVETGPSWYQSVPVQVGEQVTVLGLLDDEDFDAYRILWSDGRELAIRPEGGPPPWAGGRRDWEQAPQTRVAIPTEALQQRIRTRLLDFGYTELTPAEYREGRWVVMAISPKHIPVEIYLDQHSLEVVRERRRAAGVGTRSHHDR